MKKDLLFDLDGTIVDMRNTREIVIQQLFKIIFNKMYSIEYIINKMKKSKQNDYFNTLKLVLGEDDKEFDINELTNRFTNMYIRIAKNNEKLLIKDSVLEYLKNKYNLYIITGRPRKFYDPIWKNRLDRHFKGVICHGDYEGMPRKPEPDIIIKTIETLRLNAEYYIGNEINDIIATKKAGLKSICIMSSENRIKLLSYNCDIVIDDVNDLPNIL